MQYDLIQYNIQYSGRINMQTRGSRFIKYQELRLQELPDQVISMIWRRSGIISGSSDDNSSVSTRGRGSSSNDGIDDNISSDSNISSDDRNVGSDNVGIHMKYMYTYSGSSISNKGHIVVEMDRKNA